MNPGELEVLAGLMAEVRPAAVLEIGCNEGRTAAAMMRALTSIREYVGIDVPPGYHFEKEVQAREVPERPGHYALQDPRFRLILRPKGSLDIQISELGTDFDVVFIDGDHSRKAVQHDTRLAKSVLKPGGLVIWHDYHDLETVDVRAVLDEAYERGEPIAHVDGTWLAYQWV